MAEQYRGRGSRDREEIKIYLCSECTAHFTFPKDRLYSKENNSLLDYYEGFREYIENRQSNIFSEVGKRYSLSKGRVLDIGCGLGLSMSVANSLGWTSLGIEPSPTLAQHCKSVGLNVIQDYFSTNLLNENNGLNDGCFDYI